MAGRKTASKFTGAATQTKFALAIGFVFLLVLGVAGAASHADATQIGGIASVIDGDTIEIHGTRIRLSGIDAPEHDRQCATVRPGQLAADRICINALELGDAS